MESVRADTATLRRIAQRLRGVTAPSGLPKSNQDDYNPYGANITSSWDYLMVTLALGMIAGVFDFSSIFDLSQAQEGLSVDLINCQDGALKSFFQCNNVAMNYPDGVEREKRLALCTAALAEHVAECFAPSRMRRRLPWDDLPTLK